MLFIFTAKLLIIMGGVPRLILNMNYSSNQPQRQLEGFNQRQLFF